MHQKSILITGCSSGIGLASARLMKARGWQVLATARTDDDLEMLSGDIGVDAVPLELTNANSIKSCAEEALDRTNGRLYAVFNNAAFGQMGAVEDLSADVLRHQFEVNLFGTHDLTNRLLPAMRANGGGRIVQCSSVLGFVSLPYRGAYCASKYALEALTDAMRAELKNTGIRVSLIEPGPIRTRFLEHAVARFRNSVAIEESPHAETYAHRLEALEAGGKSLFKLEPESCALKLAHAVESTRPKNRYYVTAPTYVMAGAKRVLPSRVSDWLASII
jgi:NAD(P)-dependent dehydrogenase (short-subunit alcohol dehydrogenase family)